MAKSIGISLQGRNGVGYIVGDFKGTKAKYLCVLYCENDVKKEYQHQFLTARLQMMAQPLWPPKKPVSLKELRKWHVEINKKLGELAECMQKAEEGKND